MRSINEINSMDKKNIGKFIEEWVYDCEGRGVCHVEVRYI